MDSITFSRWVCDINILNRQVGKEYEATDAASLGFTSRNFLMVCFFYDAYLLNLILAQGPLKATLIISWHPHPNQIFDGTIGDFYY
jgi:hypothetical protein